MSRLWMRRISSAALRVGRVQADLAVEAARAAQRGVERVGAVGRADDDHLAARAQAVHQREELADDALLDLAPDLGALGRDGVDLVEEDDAGRGASARRRRPAAGAPRSRRRTCR